jgi:hypothetical protein
MASPGAHPEAPRTGLRFTIERVALGVLTTLVGINLWSGFPLLALWVGSQVASGAGLSSSAVFAVVGVLAVTELLGVFVLGKLSNRYDLITGRSGGPRRQLPWMRSMRAERGGEERRDRQLNALERIVIVLVVAAVIAFEVWFFFFAGSSLPGGQITGG